MAFLANTINWIVAISFFFGQLFRFEFQGFSFPSIDIALTLLAIANFFLFLKRKNKSVNQMWQIFLILSWISFIVNTFFLHTAILKPLFYQIRLNLLLSLYIFPKDKVISNTPIIFALLANVIFGIVQYIFWPDATLFKAFNWDPHLYRLISTYLDPTFTGLIYLMFLIFLFLKKPFPRFINNLLLTLVYIALSLTYSRSTYLALISAFVFIAIIKKNVKYFLYPLILVILTIFILPRLPGEGTKLERTSSIKAKIANYQTGIKLFTNSPFIGVGYNFLPIVRTDIVSSSHAAGGFDGSLLTLLVTNGILGFPSFILGLYQLFTKSKNYKKAMIIAILVHSLFANSLIYPWIFILLYLL